MITIRLFKATNDLASCQRFAEGHANVLRDYGVTKVTSAKNNWFYNPGAYVVVVEDKETGELYGGERIHLSNPEFPLPIEDAVGIVDLKVFDLIKSHREKGVTGELCGLWNSKVIAGKGISILLTKVGVAIANLLNMSSLFVLCAPYTVTMCQKAGFEIEESIGNMGTFYYPKLDLIATSLVVNDLKKLPYADAEFRKQILEIVNEPFHKGTEIGPKGSVEVEYSININQVL